MNTKKIVPYLFGISGATVTILLAGVLSIALLEDGADANTPIVLKDKKLADELAQNVLNSKCAACHAADAEYSTLLNLLSFGQMRRDVEGAQRSFVIGGSPEVRSSLVDFLKMDHVLRTRNMPPTQYTAVHLGSRLTSDDIEVLRTRFGEQEAFIKMFAPIAPAPAPASRIEEARILLGKLLYHDTRLSTTNTVSCASCHDLCKGGTDNLAKSDGVPGPDGKPLKGGVNAPTVYNAAGNIRQFWDGRAADLQEQAGGPPLNPVEMGYSHPSDWDKIAQKLMQDEMLVRLFRLVYPEEGICAESITHAIAAYESTLVTPGSDFDRYLLGDMNALTEQQKSGMRHFMDYGCVSCHAGATLGGISFEYINHHKDLRDQAGVCEDGAAGRKDFTKKDCDKDMFRVPNLRNVELTAPYFHTGSVNELSEAVRIMFECESGVTPSDAQVEAVTEFLKAQTGQLKGKSLRDLTPADFRFIHRK